MARSMSEYHLEEPILLSVLRLPNVVNGRGDREGGLGEGMNVSRVEWIFFLGGGALLYYIKLESHPIQKCLFLQPYIWTGDPTGI